MRNLSMNAKEIGAALLLLCVLLLVVLPLKLLSEVALSSFLLAGTSDKRILRPTFPKSTAFVLTFGGLRFRTFL
ncbi:hypothetical protein BY458DRAFT_515457 [Sporodiniella umbellata]|nr:hypothetical protein BY458DRAFT_515457 [Sporodiniella umbellata]